VAQPSEGEGTGPMAAGTQNRGLRWAVGSAGAVFVLLLVAVVLAGRPTAGVLEGTSVEGVDVSGASQDELRSTVTDLADDRRNQPVEVVSQLDRRSAERQTVGERVHVDATVTEAWERGRGTIGGLPARLRARFGATRDIQLETSIDEQVAAEWAQRIADELSTPPREGEIAFVHEPSPSVDVTQPATGEVVDGEDLADRLVGALAAQRRSVILDAPSETQEPLVGEADVEATLPRAQRAVSASVELVNPTAGEDLGLSPGQLARLLEVRRDEDAPAGERLRIVADAEALPEVVGGEAIAATEADPVEATFEIEGEEVRIRGGTSGFRIDVGAATAEIRDLAVSEGPRTGALPGEEVAPDFTREEAEDFGIERRVATFTTSYQCCPPRVTNIARMADLVNGAIIPSGTSFSLNDHVGARTEERGFVEGGVIQDGEFEDALGGGVSQFATTFFNTAFFTGIQIDEFQPHSYYIERYPVGRESTIAFGAIDVAVTNDSPHAILVASAASDTDVTVSFYSTPWAEVEAFSSEPYDRVEGDIRDGFTIDFGRTITYPDGETRTEEWTHTYQPEDADEEGDADDDGDGPGGGDEQADDGD
jgi:vancomycin resistance protein YoaR